MLTKKQKEEVIKALKLVDVKKMEIDHENPEIVKWFRFGNFSGMQIASDIILNMPERKPQAKKVLTSKET